LAARIASATAAAVAVLSVHGARRTQAFEAGLGCGAVLLPPWQRRRPVAIAGTRHGWPARLRRVQR
jgi:hypothetical protein